LSYSRREANGSAILEFPVRESENGTAHAFYRRMCRRVQCEVCEKPSYTGCGRHVDQVLKNVPKADRCHCRAANANQRRSALGIVEPLLHTSAA
jgi:hypothetical protein